MASLVEQILAQSQAGSANGATLGIDALQSGLALRQRREEFKAEQALQQERLALDRTTVAIQQSQSLLATKVNRMRLEQMEMLNQAGGSIAELELEMMQDPEGWLSAGGLDRATELAKRFPDIWGTDPWQGFIKRVQTTIQGQAQLRQLREMTGGLVETRQTIETPFGTRTFEKPTTPKVFDLPDGGKAVQTGPNSFRVLEQEGAMTPEEAAKLGLEPSGVNSAGQIIYARPRAGESLSIITPDGVQVLQQSGPGANANVPTVATRSRSQEDIVNAQKVINDLDQFESGLKAEHLGIKGVLSEEIFDRLLPQFGIDKSDPARIDTRSNLRLLIQGAMRQINIESRFSDADRKAVERAMPSPGMRETIQRAKQMTEAVRRTMAKRALIDAQAVGIAPPQFAIRSLANDALLDAFNQGLISLDIALAETERREKLKAE